MSIEEIKEKCSRGRIIWTVHGLERIQERDISRLDVKTCIMNGEIIEEYPDIFPLPGALVFGIVSGKKPLHVVCSMNDENIFIITAYVPSDEKFESDMKTRRQK